MTEESRTKNLEGFGSKFSVGAREKGGGWRIWELFITSLLYPTGCSNLYLNSSLEIEDKKRSGIVL